MKWYYLFLFIMYILFSGCTPTENVSGVREIGQSKWASVNEVTIDSHDYLLYDRGVSHSGTCRKCKQERDSVVNLIINTIENGRNSNR